MRRQLFFADFQESPTRFKQSSITDKIQTYPWPAHGEDTWLPSELWEGIFSLVLRLRLVAQWKQGILLARTQVWEKADYKGVSMRHALVWPRHSQYRGSPNSGALFFDPSTLEEELKGLTAVKYIEEHPDAEDNIGADLASVTKCLVLVYPNTLKDFKGLLRPVKII